MGFRSFVARLFNFKEEEIILTEEQKEKESGVMIESFALTTVISVIAALLAKCEFVTYENGKPVKGDLWYILNVKPNPNQCKTEFWQEYFSKLLLKMDALIIPVNDKLIIADGFSKTDNVLYGSVFTDVYRDDFTFRETFPADDVFYLKYSNANVNRIVMNIVNGYSELISETSDRYYKSGGQKGIVEVDPIARGNANFEESFKKLMNQTFRPFFKSRDAVLPLTRGYKYVPLDSKTTKTTSDVSDFKNLFDDALKRCAQAYRISPALVSGDISGIEEGLNYTLTACIDPLARMAGEMLTARNYRARDVVSGGRSIKLDTTAIKHMDIFDMAGNIDKLIASGFYSVDEARHGAGIYEIGEEWSGRHYITKNYEDIQHAEGGEENA